MRIQADCQLTVSDTRLLYIYNTPCMRDEFLSIYIYSEKKS